MASLHKRPRSPFYHAAYTGPDGRRVLRSTGATDRGEAMRLALKWEEAARGARRKTFTAAQAHRVLSECVAFSTGEKMQTYTLRTWLEEWLQGKNGATAERTLTKYTADLNTFVESLGGRADITLGAIEPGDIRRWRDARRKSGLSVTTCNLAVKVLKGSFARAVALGYIPTNPCAAVDRLKDDDAATRDVFTTEQVAALVNSADGDWRGVILCGFFTGLRMRDVTDLVWERIDLLKGLIKVPTKKTGTVVTVPLHPDLMKWLKGRERGIGKAPVFPTLFQKSGAGKSGHSSRFKMIMNNAGIFGRALRKATGQGRTQNSLSFHSLRHSFVSALANAGVASDIRQKLAGHADAKSHARYSHHEVEIMRAAVALLPALHIH